jgi:hypothetical protein
MVASSLISRHCCWRAMKARRVQATVRLWLSTVHDTLAYLHHTWIPIRQLLHSIGQHILITNFKRAPDREQLVLLIDEEKNRSVRFRTSASPIDLLG